MGIDEAGCHDKAGGVDGAGGGCGGRIADEGDAVSGDADVSHARGRACAVHYGAAAQQEVETLLLLRGEGESHKGGEGEAAHMERSTAS